MARLIRQSSICLALLVAAVGCTDLEDFRTDLGESYRGKVVGDSEASFIRRGFPVDTELLVTFDPTKVSGSQTVGTLTSTHADGTTAEFASTPYRSVEPLAHDALSEYDFPGERRVRNYIFVASPTTGPLEGRDVMIFLSLLEDGSIEARLLSGTGDASGYFGIFRLAK